MNKRFILIDYIRALAIILMIIFHFSYDLAMFKYVSIDFIRDPFWYYFPRLIVFLFLIAVGLSLPLVHLSKIKWASFNKRLTKLLLFSLIISLSTYYTNPRTWIYFGTLHCIALTSLAALPFLKHPKISLTLGIIIFSVKWITGSHIPWFYLPIASMDYIPFFPWFGVVLFGIFLFHQKFHTVQFNEKIRKTLSPLEYLSKKSLIIYLIHQPIMIGLVYLYTKAIG